jgi:hypothetical protein
MNNGQIYQALCMLGDNVKLKLNIDVSSVLDKLAEFDQYWVTYNQKKDTINNRHGLALTSRTGKIDDTMHLNSFGYAQRNLGIEMCEDNFNTYTPAMTALTEIKDIAELFTDIGRVHILRIGKGGFFPPHRDFPGLAPEYFRLSCMFGNCSDFNYVMHLHDNIFRPERNHLYFVNYQLNHNIFSFSNDLYILILTVKLNQRTHDLIIKHSMAR